MFDSDPASRRASLMAALVVESAPLWAAVVTLVCRVLGFLIQTRTLQSLFSKCCWLSITDQFHSQEYLFGLLIVKE
jgi:hypothetical protein